MKIAFICSLPSWLWWGEGSLFLCVFPIRLFKGLIQNQGWFWFVLIVIHCYIDEDWVRAFAILPKTFVQAMFSSWSNVFYEKQLLITTEKSKKHFQ